MSALYYYILDRLKEPSTWAALASGVAITTGKDPATASSFALQIAGAVSALAGMFMAENNF